MNYAFKLKNPYRADQDIKQEVITGTTLQYDYKNSPWVAVDTEYLSFNPIQDKLCAIQIASKENSDSEKIRIEIVYVFDHSKPDAKLVGIMQNQNIEKIFHVFTSDMPRIENYIGVKIRGAIFDTKVAAKIAWTNTTEYGMKSLIRMFIDPNFTQSENEKGLNDWEIGPDNWSNEQVFYMAQDVIYLDALRHRILTMAERRGTKDLVLDTMKLIPGISELYKRGYNEKVLSY